MGPLLADSLPFTRRQEMRVSSEYETDVLVEVGYMYIDGRIIDGAYVQQFVLYINNADFVQIDNFIYVRLGCL